MRLFITPCDVLLFRSGLPFSAGETTFIQSLFPPSPETVQGALRALIASHWDQNLARAFSQPQVQELIGDRSSPGRFRLGVVTLGRRVNERVERLFPAPAHLVLRTPGNTPTLLLPADPAQIADTVTNLPEGMRPLAPSLPLSEAERLEPFDAWLSEAELVACLRGDLSTIRGTQPSAIYQLEPRTGIGLTPRRRTTEEGLLYTVVMVRMQPGYGLVADVHLAPPSDSNAPDSTTRAITKAQEVCSLLRLPMGGWLSIGAERRAASYEILADPPDVLPSQGGRPLVYFATPASFAAGWRPTDWRATFGTSPVAAAVLRAQLIGGWRLNPNDAAGQAKPLRRCVPAGSVYFFDEPLATHSPYTEYGSQIGYGQAMEGVW